MTPYRVLAGSIALLLLVHAAGAPPARAFRARPGWFSGISVGVSRLDDAGFDDAALVGDVYVGLQPHAHLALEVGYVNLGGFNGRFGGSPAKLEAEGFYGNAVIIAPVTDRFDVYARGGGFQWDLERSAAGTTARGRDVDALFGGGFSLFVSANREDPTHPVDVEMQGEWTRYRVDSRLLPARAAVDVFSLSLVGHFL